MKRNSIRSVSGNRKCSRKGNNTAHARPAKYERCFKARVPAIGNSYKISHDQRNKHSPVGREHSTQNQGCRDQQAVANGTSNARVAKSAHNFREIKANQHKTDSIQNKNETLPHVDTAYA